MLFQREKRFWGDFIWRADLCRSEFVSFETDFGEYKVYLSLINFIFLTLVIVCDNQTKTKLNSLSRLHGHNLLSVNAELALIMAWLLVYDATMLSNLNNNLISSFMSKR